MTIIVPSDAQFPASTALPVDQIRHAMHTGRDYDYQAQRWVDGHDHVHVTINTGPEADTDR